jgi:phage terminase large subunit-like protein
MRDVIAELRQRAAAPKYIPTGLQEDIIYTVGCGRYQIIVAIDANRIGKTTTIINIARQIIWPDDNEYFRWWPGDNIFTKWPYASKRFRLGGTPTNLADNGALQQAIDTWWPPGKFTRDKAGKHHYSVYKCGDWSGDALTYEQAASEWEGATVSLQLFDEPPKPALIGSITSRMAEGGVVVFGMTPINCGVFLDVLDDLRDKGKRIQILSGSVWDNDVDTGKANHNNTRRGLWTKEQIDDYVAGIPIDERPARCEGKASHKSGKIYPQWDQQVHGIDFRHEYLSQCNCYMSIDPHRKYYPAILWFAVTPSGMIVVYNEYPKFDDLQAYYAEVRSSKQFTKTNEELANIILANDLSHEGAVIMSRTLDPHYHADDTEFIVRMGELGVAGWIVPDSERIEVQRKNLQGLLNYNPAIPVIGSNAPDWYEDNSCRNSQRAQARHYWEEGKDKESEEYKDFVDAKRYFLSQFPSGRPIWIDRKLIAQAGVPKSLAEQIMDKRPAKGYFNPQVQSVGTQNIIKR